MSEAKIGRRNWQDGIDLAQLYWDEAYAYQREIYKEVQRPSPDRMKLNQLVTGLSSSLTGLRDAIHTLELIGIRAKESGA